MAIERRPIGKPVVHSVFTWQWCAIWEADASPYKFHNLELVCRSIATGEEAWASGPVKAYSEIWTEWETWLDVDAGGTGIIVENGDPLDSQGLLGDGESIEAPIGVSVLVENLFVVDTMFGVVIAWNLNSRNEAWRLDPSTREDIRLHRILGALPDRILLYRLQQLTQDCTIDELPHLEWDEFPAGWDEAEAEPVEVQDLAEGYSVKQALCSVNINGSMRAEEWEWPSIEGSVGHDSWTESVKISPPSEFTERSTGSQLGLQTRGDDNYRLWGRLTGEFPIPKRPKGTFESLTEGTLTRKNAAAPPGTTLDTADYVARWWWQQTRRGTLPEDPVYVEGAVENPNRTFVRHGTTVSNATLQALLDDVREEIESIDELSGRTDLQNEALTFWPYVANRQIMALDTTQLTVGDEADLIGATEIVATQRLYYLTQVPSPPFDLLKANSEVVYWNPRYSCFTATRFIAGPKSGGGVWVGFDVATWEKLWQFDYTEHPERPRQIYATNIPIISGPHLITLVRALDSTTEELALVLLVLDVETGAIVREVDLEENLTDEDLRFQAIVSGGHILFRLAGKLQKIPLG